MVEFKKVLMVSLLVLALTFICFIPFGVARESKDFDKSLLFQANLEPQGGILPVML